MKRMLITSVAGFTLMGFGGCSQLGGPSPAATYPAVQPTVSLRVAAPSSDASYARGREAQAAGRWRQAADEFKRVLELDPRHLEAINALAVAYAESGELDESLLWFEHALALAPAAAHVHNNYGYALYRLGRLDDAEQALRRAQDLDPGHARTRQNMMLVSEARAKLAVESPAMPVMAGVPAATATIVTVAPRPSAAAGPDLSSAADPRLALVRIEPQVYQLRDERAPALPTPASPVAAAPAAGTATVPTSTAWAAVPMPAPSAAVPAPRPAVPLDFAEIVSDGDKALVALRFTPRQLGLEIANGVGVAGLAKRTAKQLVRVGLPAVRLTNVPHYQEPTTVIQYRQGHEAAAQALSGALPISVGHAGSDDLRFDINVRLVLGHDNAGRILAGLDPLPAVVLAWTAAPASVSRSAAAGDSGWRWS